jgi:HAD superfamily hydrolase (TIGR01509 family)
MVKAVIFDMEGTMINTHHLWREAEGKLAKKYNAVMDETLRTRMIGRRDRDGLSAFKEYNKLEVEVEELITERRKIVLEDLSSAYVNKGLYELLDLLDALALKKAVATSSFTEFAYKILDVFDLRRRFDSIVTGDGVKNGKPAPEIFLKAAEKLEVKPEDCLVLEDAQVGVVAGYNAGMKVIAIPHKYSMHHDFSKATKILTSMLELDQSLLSSL